MNMKCLCSETDLDPVNIPWLKHELQLQKDYKSKKVKSFGEPTCSDREKHLHEKMNLKCLCSSAELDPINIPWLNPSLQLEKDLQSFKTGNPPQS